MTSESITTLDVVIFGGGVAGLWTLNRLRQQGYRTILFEANHLGEGQTRFAQGIIHGGTKYALTGKLTASAEAVGKMPGVWRDCLAGRGDIDLQQVRVLSQNQFLWSTAKLTSRISGFFASHAMKSRTRLLGASERPAVFQSPAFRGQVYQLDEVVLDTASLIQTLAEPCHEAIFRCQDKELSFQTSDVEIEIHCANRQLRCRQVVLCAGEGNEGLLSQLGMKTPQMQRRPLHMVMLRGMSEPLFAHCMGMSTVPRLTITSYPDETGGWIWYLGGQLAEEGVKRQAQEQIDIARQEMQALFPWLELSACEWATLRIDRAEPYQADGKRPDTIFVQQTGVVMTAWPTKLALAPLLADEVINRLVKSEILPTGESQTEPEVSLGQFPGYAPLPWQEESRWN